MADLLTFAAQQPAPATLEDELLDALVEFSNDPLGFVYWAFPWGVGELADALGPEPWQIKILTQIREGLSIDEAIQIARASGHGIGKSALVAWIIIWAFSTFEDTRGVVTANTENQLKTKTWAELAKWFNLFAAKDLFEFSATRLTIRSPDTEKQSKWRIDMVPWSERNPEAFAGLHNKNKRILIVFDEASAIGDMIWETTEGALTDADTQIIWVAFGNPTKNKGRFRECFPGGRFAHRWRAEAIDSRTVSFTDKKIIQRWVDDWGEDSDFVRIRVRGIFPRVDAVSFISWDSCRLAISREVPAINSHPLVMGVDVARFGDDASVIYFRRGLDGRSIPPEIYYGIDTMKLAARVAAAYDRHQATTVFVDGGGVGGGVVDRLRQLQIPVWEVDFGSSPDGTNPGDPSGTKYYNKRAEIWGAMRTWLTNGCIGEGTPGQIVTLTDELTGPTYGHSSSEEIQLEKKSDMKRRGVASPNIADALACTFAYPVFIPPSADSYTGFGLPKSNEMPDYDPYSHERIYG